MNEVIHVLQQNLKEKDVGVRESAVQTLGVLGMPEAMEAVQDIIALLKDQDSNVKAMAVWTIGRMGPQACKMAAQA